MIIKKGRKSIWRLPKFLKKRTVYSKRLIVTDDLFLVDDSCDSGWNKLWGVFFGYIHWASFRFVFRITNDNLKIGYYVYRNWTSPQQDNSLKGELSVGKLKAGDYIDFHIDFRDKVYMSATTKHGTDKVHMDNKKGLGFLLMEARPNIKCKAVKNIKFNLN